MSLRDRAEMLYTKPQQPRSATEKYVYNVMVNGKCVLLARANLRFEVKGH